MLNNLINVVAKAFAGFVVVVTLIGLAIGGGGVPSSYIGIAATIGMIAGFGAIMIGELIFELKIYLSKCKFMKKVKEVEKKKKEEAAQ